MSDFSTGAIVDDDLDLSAAKGRSKSHEAVAAKTAAWGGKGLNAAIGTVNNLAQIPAGDRQPSA